MPIDKFGYTYYLYQHLNKSMIPACTSCVYDERPSTDMPCVHCCELGKLYYKPKEEVAENYGQED